MLTRKFYKKKHELMNDNLSGTLSLELWGVNLHHHLQWPTVQLAMYEPLKMT
jgi:hypothetical protein